MVTIMLIFVVSLPAETTNPGIKQEGVQKGILFFHKNNLVNIWSFS